MAVNDRFYENLGIVKPSFRGNTYGSNWVDLTASGATVDLPIIDHATDSYATYNDYALGRHKTLSRSGDTGTNLATEYYVVETVGEEGISTFTDNGDGNVRLSVHIIGTNSVRPYLAAIGVPYDTDRTYGFALQDVVVHSGECRFQTISILGEQETITAYLLATGVDISYANNLAPSGVLSKINFNGTNLYDVSFKYSIREALPASTTYTMKDTYQSYFTTDVPVTEADLAILDADPEAIYRLVLENDTTTGLSFLKTNVMHFPAGIEGRVGGSVVQDLIPAYSSTNLANYTEDLTTWQKVSDIAVTGDQGIAPDGTLTADLITWGAVESNRLMFEVTDNSDLGTWSVYLKQGTATFVRVLMTEQTNFKTCGVKFDFITEAITISSTGVDTPNYGFEKLKNGWYRIFIAGDYTGITHTTKKVHVQCYIDPDAGKTMYIWGGQYEPDTIIPTAYEQVVATTTVSGTPKTYYPITDYLETVRTNIENTNQGASLGLIETDDVGMPIGVADSNTTNFLRNVTVHTDFVLNTERWTIIEAIFGMLKVLDVDGVWAGDYAINGEIRILRSDGTYKVDDVLQSYSPMNPNLTVPIELDNVAFIGEPDYIQRRLYRIKLNTDLSSDNADTILYDDFVTDFGDEIAAAYELIDNTGVPPAIADDIFGSCEWEAASQLLCYGNSTTIIYELGASAITASSVLTCAGDSLAAVFEFGASAITASSTLACAGESYDAVYEFGVIDIDTPSATLVIVGTVTTPSSSTDTGWIIPDTGVSENYNSGEPWTNPSNVTTDSQATVAYADPSKGEETYYLLASNYDFSAISSGDAIDGIEVQIEHRGETTVVDIDVLRLFQSTTPVGDDKSTNNEIGTSWVADDFGGATDDWNASLDADDILASTFGVGVVYTNTTTPVGNKWVEVNTIRMKIHYTPA